MAGCGGMTEGAGGGVDTTVGCGGMYGGGGGGGGGAMGCCTVG